MKKLITAALAAVALVSLLETPASAAVCDKTIRLTATAAGADVQADGRARLRSDARGRQSFRVEISVALPNGTLLTVSANGVVAGTAEVIAGRAVLDLNNAAAPLPAGIDPVCAITSVSVADPAGAILLTGAF